MIKISWEKVKERWRKGFTVKSQVEFFIDEWDYKHKDTKEIAKKITNEIECRIINEVSNQMLREMLWEYNDQLKERIAEQMLKDEELAKMIKQSFVNHATHLLEPTKS